MITKPRRRLLAAAAATVSAAALLGLGLAQRHAAPPPPAPAAAPVAAAPRAPALPAAPAKKGIRARYRISIESHVVIDGREQASVVVEGALTTTDRTHDEKETRFAASRIDVKGAPAPTAADVAAPFEQFSGGGVLGAVGFPESTPPAGRALLTSLVTTFQHTDRPGDAWSVEEEDQLGRYEADYQRTGADRVVRGRPRYTALREGRGLSPDRAASLVPSESTELLFDDHGLRAATVRVDLSMVYRKGKEPLRIAQLAKLVRETFEEVPLVDGLPLAADPITDHADRAAVARGRDEARVHGATATELVAEAERVAHLDRKQPDTGKQRAATLERLSSLVNLDPSAGGALADAIRRDPRDAQAVSLIAGALSSSRSPEGANALASLLSDDALPDDARSTVLTSLALAHTPTADSAAALSEELDDPSSGDQAALALGAQARGLGSDGAGGDAVDQLLGLYQNASSPAQQVLYLQALGNAGSRSALDTIMAAIQSPDLQVARAAVFALRLIPGDDVDDTLWSLIQAGGPLAITAVQAVAYRSAALWAPRLQLAKTEYAGQQQVLDTISSVLVRWATTTGARAG